jgi:2-iminoacetate synthase ThiH
MLKKDNKQYVLTHSELECLLNKASKKGAKEALSEIGLDDVQAYVDILSLRELLKSLRIAKKHAFRIFIKWLVIGIMGLITAGFIALIGDNINLK